MTSRKIESWLTCSGVVKECVSHGLPSPLKAGNNLQPVIQVAGTRDAAGVEWGGKWGGGIPFSSRREGLGSVVSSPRLPGPRLGRKRIEDILSVTKRFW